MPDSIERKPFRLRLIFCGLLLLAASGCFAWSAFAYEDSAGIIYAVLLIPTAIGVIFRQVWARYFVFSYAATWIVALCVETPPYLWTHEVNIISLVISFVPSAFMLIISWNVYRGFQD